MGKIKRVLRCHHCGEILQSKSSKEKGFIDTKIINAPNAENQLLYCSSCYDKVKAVNSGMLAKDADDEILKILDDAVATDAVIIWVIDLFSFNGFLNADIVKKIKKLKLIVCGTKYDLFSKTIKKEKLINFINERFNEADLNPNYVVLFGNTNDIDVEKYLKRLNEFREGHDVYMIGTLSSGKTTLINKMLKSYKNTSKRVIKTEKYPGTNVQLLEIPFSNSSSFYEVPGFSLVNNLLGRVEKEIQKIIVPKKEIKVSLKTLSNGESLMIGCIASITLISGKPTTFKLYSSDKVETKRINVKKLPQEFHLNIEKKLIRPVSTRFITFADFDVFDYDMENDGKVHDISITGLGWISFVAKGQTIRVWTPKGVAIKECLGKIR